MEKQRWGESEKSVRKGTKVAKHCVFPMICGSGGSKSRPATRHYTTRHYTTPHYTTVNDTHTHYTMHNYNYNDTIHCTTRHYTNAITLHDTTPLQHATVQHTTVRDMTAQYTHYATPQLQLQWQWRTERASGQRPVLPNVASSCLFQASKRAARKLARRQASKRPAVKVRKERLRHIQAAWQSRNTGHFHELLWKGFCFFPPPGPATIFRHASAALPSLCCNIVKFKCTRLHDLESRNLVNLVAREFT